MDAKFYNGNDDRASLTAAHDTPTTMAPTCKGCGFVVYKVGVRLPYGGALCKPCAEQAEREPEPSSESFIDLTELQQMSRKVKR